MQDTELQLDMFDRKPKKKSEKAAIAPLRTIHTVTDLGEYDFRRPRSFRVVRVSPTEVIIWNAD